jgi:hypothetical protein
MDVLLTWVGSRDPGWNNPRTKKFEPGPILSLLDARRFDRIHLLFNLFSPVDDFRKRATDLQRVIDRRLKGTTVVQKPVDLVSVIDYIELFRVANDSVQAILGEYRGRNDADFFVYLSPGTPQMQAVWILLVQSGLLPAHMIEGTPPDLLAPGAPRWREVNLSIPNFPQVANPNETARMIGILQAQNDNLLAQNQMLAGENAALKAGANLLGDEITESFSLPAYLVAQERALFVRALHEAAGNAAEAARRLGITPAAFRARATTLGVRARRARNSQT